jgi:hypothetical protein
MSTEAIEAEIKRFLSDDKPGVLCLKGKWGVGKTFAWRKWLGDVQRDGALKATRYAYVSLFGLNSLEGLRYSIFESTVTPEHLLTGPNVGTLDALVRKGFDLGRKSKSLLEPILALAGAKDGGEAIFRSAYLLVKNQLVCLDDLERAGAGLNQRDILGLASSLKEQRNCKVVLLLNDEEMEEAEKAEFDRQLEKVVDIPLVFDPSPEDAAAIALAGDTDLEQMLRTHLVHLGIVNIRVIKKIERLADRLMEILAGRTKPVVDQAIAAVVLGGWVELQKNEAPPFETLKTYNRLAASLGGVEGGEGVQPKWVDRLQGYPFAYADDFDLLIFDGVQRGFFNEKGLQDAAIVLEHQLAQNARENSFSRAWEQYWQDLAVDDDELLSDIYKGALENLKAINPVNISGTVKLFREAGWDTQADELIAAYVAAHDEDKRFFDLRQHHFMRDDEPDPRLLEVFSEKFAEFVDERDPREMLRDISRRRGWNDEDVALLAGMSVDELVAMFEGIKGPDLKASIQLATQLGRSGSPESEKLAGSLTEAMKVIAAKSPQKKRRLNRWGVYAE